MSVTRFWYNLHSSCLMWVFVGKINSENDTILCGSTSLESRSISNAMVIFSLRFCIEMCKSWSQFQNGKNVLDFLNTMWYNTVR